MLPAPLNGRCLLELGSHQISTGWGLCYDTNLERQARNGNLARNLVSPVYYLTLLRFCTGTRIVLDIKTYYCILKELR